MLVAAGLLAAGDWYAVERENKRAEYLLKPAALVALIAVAAAIEAPDASRARWFLVALVLSLCGDIFLVLPKDAFVAGLASFLLAHLAYLAGWVSAGVDIPVVATVLVVLWLVASPLLARILRALRESGRDRLRLPVVAYSVAISAMVAGAVAGGIVTAIAGSLLFFSSDLMIAWSRFVRPFTHARLGIMVTYHLGQALLVLSLTEVAG